MLKTNRFEGVRSTITIGEIDLWLFERYGNEFRDEYIKWLSQETLDECDKNLSNEQKVKLRECFELQ